MAGFFIIEDSILKSGNELMTRAQVDNLWEMAVAKIKLVLNEQFGYITNPETFLDVKKIVILFAKTLEGYTFFAAPLFEFLSSQRERFEQHLFRRLRDEVKHVIIYFKFI